MNLSYFTIDSDKLIKVTEIFNEKYDTKTTAVLIKAEILADWHNADDHQKWIDEADPAVISDWLASFVDFSD